MSSPDIDNIKDFLTDIKPNLSAVADKGSLAFVWTHGEGMVKNGPFYSSSIMRAVAEETVEIAHIHAEDSEYKPLYLGGYIGRTSVDQIVSYIHSDSVAQRLTRTVAEVDCETNPSTLLFPIHHYDMTLYNLLSPHLSAETRVADLPDEVASLARQASEGSVTTILRNQAHAECPLPFDTAKVFLSSTADRLR